MNREIDLISVLKKALHHRILILCFAAAGGATGVLLGITTSPQYESVARLLPSQQSQDVSKLSGLAALAGVSLGNTGGSLFDNIPQLMSSPLFLDTLTRIKWRTVDHSEPRFLEEIYSIEVELNPKTPHITTQMMIDDKLNNLLQEMISYDSYSGTKSITVKARDPYLAHDINLFLIGYLDEYINKKRQTNSRHQLQFLEGRLEEYQKELARSEEALRRFQQQNRTITTPGLELEQRRLLRNLTLNETIYNELRKQLETTKIDVEREIEVLNIFQPPSMPIWKTKPKKKILAAGGFAAGVVLGCFFSFMLFWYRENITGIKNRWNKPIQS